MQLVDEVLGGSRRALARLMSLLENDGVTADEAQAALFPHTGSAHLIGVTGAPGTGKSSLVNQLALGLRQRGKTVGIVAVDPTSPFSGGAILGDRIRMRDLSGDPGIFIRSMASRGSLGGLAKATSAITRALDAAGFDIVLIETVGAGQSEVDIARYAHTVIVVEAPGLGDDVQAIKAGILEIADVLIVNKADDPRAENTARALQAMLTLGRSDQPRQILHHGRLITTAAQNTPASDASPETGWDVPILRTNALTGEGVEGVLDALEAHHDHLLVSGELAQREQTRAVAELDERLRETLLMRLLNQIDHTRMAEVIKLIAARELSPQSAASLLIESQDGGSNSHR